MEEKLSCSKEPDPGGDGTTTAGPPRDPGPVNAIGRQLSEQGRFAYAAVCAVSLGQLFTARDNSVFREDFLQGLVHWLDLDESVMPVMGAFLSGLGFEGSDTFLSILQAEPLLTTGATPIIQDLVSFSVKDGQYDARSRVLIRHVSCLLRVSSRELEEFEETLGERLKEAGEESEEESSRRRRRERGRKLRRYLLIGLATVGGGTVIGVTGGLAAPLVAAGAGAVLGASGAAALGSATGIAIMASLFGAAGAGLTGYKMNKCVGEIEEFEFLPLNSGKHLHLTVAVTGWLCSGKYSSFQAPWCSLGDCGEQYCLVWESRFLRDLGSALASLLDGLVSMVAQEALKYTVLSGIVTALTWPASLLAAASVIDHPWCVCLNRSAEVGKHLAQVLRSRQQGKRPVSLIGFSLGARVIYHCLQELATDHVEGPSPCSHVFTVAQSGPTKHQLNFNNNLIPTEVLLHAQKDDGSEGVVEDVVLLGAPVEGSEKAWERMSRVVAGKIVNGYCRGDWLLGFLYRSSAAQLSVAGLQPINTQDRRIINVDLSSVVKGHLDYMRQMDTILVAVGVPTKEVPGASFTLPDSVKVTEGTEVEVGTEVTEEVASEQPATETPKLSKTEKSGDMKAESENEEEELGNGWDFSDISDLLDQTQMESEFERTLTTVENDTNRDTASAFNAVCHSGEEVEPDSKHISWSWDDPLWTPESNKEQRQPNL